ncbi:RNA recognition motif domain [Cinara cedri]|uniref:RNA recognition motif domain n=1 Tax=Cinara cedri TaxID=506608 RepID=A0A5E4MCL0_9HEMI|nr:RNA recognition motif domain [Cinara cedri]
MEMFSQKGNVTNIRLVFTYEKNNCCFALITYQIQEEAKTALIHFDKTYLDSFSVRIGIEYSRKSSSHRITVQYFVGIVSNWKKLSLRILAMPRDSLIYQFRISTCTNSEESSGSGGKDFWRVIKTERRRIHDCKCTLKFQKLI